MLPYLRFGGWNIPLYGVCVTAAYAIGALWLWRNRGRCRLTAGMFWVLGYFIFFGALAGARLGFYVNEWDFIRSDPSFIWRYWSTGWVFWTGFLGTMIMGWLYQQVLNRFYKPRAYLPVADYFAPMLALGSAIGRLGCFFQGCCYGMPTTLPWGVGFIHPAASVPESLMGVPLHPVQLYEAAGQAALFVFFAHWVLPRIRSRRFRFGTSFLGYIFLYSALRFATEYFRGDDRGVLLSPVLSPGQWTSLAGLLISGAALWKRGIVEKDLRSRSWYLTRGPAEGPASS